jgi:hypothetical protein
MLTLEKLKEMSPHAIIATGVTIDNYTGINMSNSDRVLRWVAVRGNIHDWAIYIAFDTQSVEQVRRGGDKVHGEENIKKLVPCDKEAFKLYRY